MSYIDKFTSTLGKPFMYSEELLLVCKPNIEKSMANPVNRTYFIFFFFLKLTMLNLTFHKSLLLTIYSLLAVCLIRFIHNQPQNYLLFFDIFIWLVYHVYIIFSIMCHSLSISKHRISALILPMYTWKHQAHSSDIM